HLDAGGAPRLPATRTKCRRFPRRRALPECFQARCRSQPRAGRTLTRAWVTPGVAGSQVFGFAELGDAALENEHLPLKTRDCAKTRDCVVAPAAARRPLAMSDSR